MIVRKSPAELEVMARAGRVVAEVHELLREAVRPGLSTLDLDRLAEAEVRARGATPSFKGYRGFPATLCVSVNAEVVHGIPSVDRVLGAGDLCKIDLGAVVDGYHADAAVTWVVGGTPPPGVQALVDGTYAALWAGLAAAVPGARVGDVSAAVQAAAQARGLGIVRGFTGHGVGRALHEEPPVPNRGRRGRGPALEPGVVIAIEPMLVLGDPDVALLDDGWTAVTADGGLAAHWEHTVAVTARGPWVLTARPGEPERPLEEPAPVDAAQGG
jgi:methionyl aminopeptidase